MSEKLRSRIFHELSSFKKEFREDLNVTWELTNEQRSSLLDSLPDMIKAKTDRELMIARQHAVQAIGGSAIYAIKAADVMLTIGGWWDPIEDEVDSVLEDFERLELLPTEPGRKNDVLKFLRSFFEFLKSDSERVLNEKFSRRLLPSITNLITVVDFRSVVESKFDWRNDNPDEYRPVIHRTIPIVILKFFRDEGDPVVLQASQDEIEMIIRQLQATLKEIDASIRIQSG